MKTYNLLLSECFHVSYINDGIYCYMDEILPFETLFVLIGVHPVKPAFPCSS